MRCDVLLFAQVRDAIGKDRLVIELPEGATVRDALDSIAARHEPISALRGRLAVAVNQRYAQANTVLREGDVLALIPPVSGG